ncbi:hypothetical protein EYF80_029030 [Liparis tanakae]|uniref:Uncharacterized protein n=1 Tax=Liparis tanakae TaxID=230148 RepID=A0A4Z2H4H3_9TELE|nr:hypothetical protein EYF80_029030 [Liparis tanakae]
MRLAASNDMDRGDLCRPCEVGCGAFEDLGPVSADHHLSPEQGHQHRQTLQSHGHQRKHKRLQEVVDASTDFLWGEAVQQQLQGLHTLRHQVDAAVLHRAGQEAQQTRASRKTAQIMLQSKCPPFACENYVTCMYNNLKQELLS